MKWSILFCFVLSPVLFIQCDDAGTSNVQQHIDTTKTIGSQVNPPSAATTTAQKVDTYAIEQKGQTMAVSSFNQSVVAAMSKEESWVNSPILVALKFCGEDMECRKKSIELESTKPGESFDDLRVVITEEGYLDDSLNGSMVILQVSKTGGMWQIKKATQAWTCRQGRGHVDYSAEPCS